MKTIISTLENNEFSGILVKKGTNKISDKDYNNLLLNVNFCTFTGLGFIKIEGAKFEKVKEIVRKAFEEMTQPELKSYVIKNNIKVPSFKKVDILATLKQIEEKGE